MGIHMAEDNVSKCSYCEGFGYCRIYIGGRTTRVYCDCVFGDQQMARVAKVLVSAGIDPGISGKKRRADYVISGKYIG